MTKFSEGETIVPLISAKTIAERVCEIGKLISAEYADRNITFVATLKGAAIFWADLVRQVSSPSRVHFIRLSSYNAQTTRGKVQLEYMPELGIAGSDVILVEDIVDTGLTARFVIDLLQDSHPASLKLCSLLDKPSRRVVHDIKIDYLGFSIPDKFVVGYGLDYDQRYRGLPYIGEVVFEGDRYSNNAIKRE